MDPNLHPSFGGSSLAIRYHQTSTPKWMGKRNGSIKSWNNIRNAEPIVIKIISQTSYPWWSLHITM
jgi:hypothetical protein